MKTSHANKCPRSVIKENYTASRSVVHKREMVFVGQDPTRQFTMLYSCTENDITGYWVITFYGCNNCYRKQWCILYCMFQGVEQNLHGIPVLEPCCGSPNNLQLPAADKLEPGPFVAIIINVVIPSWKFTSWSPRRSCSACYTATGDLIRTSVKGTCCCKGRFNECDKQQKYNCVLHLSQLHTFSWNN